uniref:glycogen/starch/alpha-glucan phosphorylase n=1 Tax=Clostridium sp. 12(A) TaxID=1163671 RepID=UPI00054CFB2B
MVVRMLGKSVQDQYGKKLQECSNEEIYMALLEMTKSMANEKKGKESKKKVYYISAEFLIGKLLSNNLINLGIYDEVREELAQNGKSITEIENVELEPSLGNGGLGRLAACFLDSIASLGLNGDGIGLNYHLGLFRQLFKENLQKETTNPWITKHSWLTKRDISYTVPFKDFSVTSTLYDIAVTGYENRTNHLHLFDLDTVDESIVGAGISFDKEDIRRNLTLFLYPDDSDEKGELLRIYQQYFMVSNGAQMIIEECEKKGSSLKDLNEYAVIQINDTHPTMIIPELIRLLIQKGIDMEEAIEIVSKTCAYTNHTILAEALEKWPIRYLEKVVPHLLPIIEVLDQRVRSKFDDPSVYIIDKEECVHMAHIDIHYGFSVNGVAALHTEILKENELNNFYKIYPQKFNNKTNGITFRRWLMHCNYPLTSYISELIGDGFKKDAGQLEKLLAFREDSKVLNTLLQIKNENKKVLKEYLMQTQGIPINENSIFDIQIKRLHEYKRQQMNALYVIYKYLEIKKGNKPKTPITIIFGAKAAPAYIIAKDIIHLILCLQDLISKDPEVNPYLNVVMVENYNVTLAEKLIPACEISEQISLASKEASGTGNMKFMLNGAITLGTMDGANVEIADLVGEDNIYIFGKSSEEVIAHYDKQDYVSKDFYENDALIHKLVDFIVSDTLMQVGRKENLERLHHEFISKDWFMSLLDLREYISKKEEIIEDYEDSVKWSKMMLENISRAGYFSSDRTIRGYNQDIWKL